MMYVLGLDNLGSRGWEAGNKAASLARMIAAGIAVPTGHAITYSAFEDSISAAGAEESFAALLEAVETADIPDMAVPAEAVRDFITHLDLAPGLCPELRGLESWLASHTVSVRSSSSLEDAGALSFAGQHDSFLEISGLESVEAHVRRVWASAYTDRAVAYLRMLGRSLHEIRMGVVIQQMVPATAAGVAFTIHPVSGDRDVVHLSAAPGLGEVTVSGAVTPDEAVIVRADLTLSEYTRADESVEVLAPAACIRVAEQSLAIEKLFGGVPTDIEFAYAGDALWILQARPMVVAPARLDEGVTWQSPIPGANWQRNWRLGEWLPHPITPLFGSWILPQLVASREEFGTDTLGWGDMQTFSMPQPWFVLINGYFYTRTDFPGFGRQNQPLEERLERMVKTTKRVQNWREVHLPRYVALHLGRRDKNIAMMPSRALLDYVDLLVAEAGEFWSFIAPIGYGFEEMVFRPIYDRLIEGEKPHHAVLFAGYTSRMTDAQQQLYELAERVRQDSEAQAAVLANRDDLGKLPAWLQQAIADYDLEFGHQVLSLDTWWPTLGENPAYTLKNLAMLVGQQIAAPVTLLQAAAERRDAAVADLSARLADEKRAGFMTTVTFYQGNASVREDCNFYLQAGWPHIRRALATLGERLCEAGVLGAPGQVHFLQHDELVGALDALEGGSAVSALAAVATAREEAWNTQRTLSAPIRIGDRPPPPSGVFDETTGILHGNGASPGVYTGRARVLLVEADAALVEKGDVLILKAASPLFTPLLLMAGALVVEVGGGASHSSLVARELGLPAVVNATNATTLFRDGEMLSVDGAAGTVAKPAGQAGRAG